MLSTVYGNSYGGLVKKRPILEVRDVYKNYGNTPALCGLNLIVPEFSCFGILGPNGSGKSTLMEIVEGLKKMDSGEILFRGVSIEKYDPSDKLGIQFQRTGLQQYMTVYEALKTFASLYTSSIPLEEIIEQCQLQEFLHMDHKKISGGQRQRLLLGMALINKPELIFLDEPTVGLDASSRARFWRFIEKIKAERKSSVILSTHYMEEAYTVCDEIAIVSRGKALITGDPRQLLSSHFQSKRISFSQVVKDDLSHKFNGWKWQEEGGRLGLDVADIELSSTIKKLLEEGVNMESMEVHSKSLEDLLIKLMDS